MSLISFSDRSITKENQSTNGGYFCVSVNLVFLHTQLTETIVEFFCIIINKGFIS